MVFSFTIESARIVSTISVFYGIENDEIEPVMVRYPKD